MHIVIAGNIGSGKTTLTKMLARHYGWDLRLESVTYNPYLEDYYKDMPRWALNLEVYFLKERFRDLLEIRKSAKPVIQDRSIYEGVYIFSANNHDMGNMSDHDFETYMGLFNSIMMAVKQPDLMVYLKASVPHLVDNIHKRGREYEQNMRLDYLKNLNDRYDRFFQRQYKGPKITVDVENLDFVRNKEDFATITSIINKKIDVNSRSLFV
ncbi:deoxynucleoside kinase [Hallella multisaccharivorax DSM 17128]|uniref:Deoxyadenosine kinase n=1 Tax=Hallella multisaccharivorax DSM 17128 TaxID=688246 RepID=F8N5K7_9BACT|nr:deoxynucleoside kinase [Hallella multisaccharivorax]EGN58165.1 Deoxyadenosine kinase [Hallella multisaccharivorax DSM 17128]GJG31741.1 deoxynucleoside kinase [Hallella multisaccharivorax DSM 17128]